MYHRHNHHNGRRDRRPPLKRAQSQEEIYQENQRARLAELDASARRLAEAQAEFEKLPPEERARIEEWQARVAAASWADHLYQVACRDKRDRDRNDSQSLGT